jgi:hypothetical protein
MSYGTLPIGLPVEGSEVDGIVVLGESKSLRFSKCVACMYASKINRLQPITYYCQRFPWPNLCFIMQTTRSVLTIYVLVDLLLIIV